MKKERKRFYKNAAGALATASSAIIVLAAEGTLPNGGIGVLYLAAVGASIPLLLCFYICHYFIYNIEHDKEQEKVANWYMDRLFASGAASAFAGYCLLLAKAGLFVFIGFMFGFLLALLGFYKVVMADNKAKETVKTNDSPPDDPTT